MASGQGAGRAFPRIPLAVASGLTVGVLSGVVVLQFGGDWAFAGDGDRSEPSARESETVAAAPPDAFAGDEPAAARRDAGIAIAADGGAPDAEAPVETDAGEVIAEGPDDDTGELSDPSSDQVRSATLSFDVTPADPRGLSISVDGEPVSGRTHVVEFRGGGTRLNVRARARGFLTWSRAVPVRGDRRIVIELERPEASDDGPGGAIDLGL